MHNTVFKNKMPNSSPGQKPRFCSWIRTGPAVGSYLGILTFTALSSLSPRAQPWHQPRFAQSVPGTARWSRSCRSAGKAAAEGSEDRRSSSPWDRSCIGLVRGQAHEASRLPQRQQSYASCQSHPDTLCRISLTKGSKEPICKANFLSACARPVKTYSNKGRAGQNGKEETLPFGFSMFSGFFPLINLYVFQLPHPKYGNFSPVTPQKRKSSWKHQSVPWAKTLPGKRESHFRCKSRYVLKSRFVHKMQL